MGARARCAVAVALAAVTTSACGGRPAPTTAPTAATTSAVPTTTSADSCYLVTLDLQTLAALPAGGSRATVLAQLTTDASTGSPALKAAVAAYLHGTGSTQAIHAAC